MYMALRDLAKQVQIHLAEYEHCIKYTQPLENVKWFT